MLDALEREIIEKFRQLDEEGQRRVRSVIEQEAGVTAFDFEQWVADIEALRQKNRAQHDDHRSTIDVVETLRQIRDGEDE
jgi:hypothetical protein